jgi:hypothetical protein
MRLNAWSTVLRTFLMLPISHSVVRRFRFLGLPGPRVTLFPGKYRAHKRPPGDPVTLESYAKSFRKIVADSMGIESDKTRFDYKGGGHAQWLARVHGIKLRALTPERVQRWKKSFLAKAKADPVSQRRAKVSVNSFLRQARSLFSQRNVLSHLGGIELPGPLPFAQINFEQANRSASNETLAVFLSKSTFASGTPGTFSSAFLTVIGQTAQVIFCTSRVTVCKVPANRVKGSAMAPSRTKRCISDFIVNKTVAPATVRKLGQAQGP